MKKAKFLSMLVITSAIIISTATVTLAMDYGGWDETRGNYINKLMKADSLLSAAVAASTPQHTGKRESKVINGTDNYRAHGWTTWVGMYHYTRARMEGDGSTVLTDSGRIWGLDGTEAISPWLAFNPNTYGVGYARTYYGS